MRRGVFLWFVMFFWSGQVLSSVPVGLIPVSVREGGPNPVFSGCNRLPSEYQREGCNDFMIRLNPEYPELLTAVESTDHRRLRSILRRSGREKHFSRIQLVTEPASLGELMESADGETAFILDARYGDYYLDKTIFSRHSFALIGVVNQDDVKPGFRLGNDFGGSLFEMFALDIVDSGKTAIFSNLAFELNSSATDTLQLEFVIQSSSPLEYLIIDQVDFYTEGMKGHSLLNLVSLNDMRGVANIVGSNMDLSRVKHYGVVINACHEEISEGCASTLKFNNNNATGLEYSGVLQARNIDNFQVEQNNFAMSGNASFLRDSKPVAVFNLIYDAISVPVAGLFSLNTVIDCNGQFPFAIFNSASEITLSEVTGQVVFNQNNYGDCGGYQASDTLPALKLTDELPKMLKAALAEVSSSFGLSVSDGSGEPELTSSVDAMTRDIVATVSSVESSSMSVAPSIASSVSSTPVSTPSPSLTSSFAYSSTSKPYSSSHQTPGSTHSKALTTTIESGSSTEAINPSSASRTMISPSSTLSSFSSTVSSGVDPIPTITPMPPSGSGSGAGSGIEPFTITGPTVLPPKQKGLSNKQLGGIAVGAVGLVLFLGGEYFLIRHCINNYSNFADIPWPLNVITIGMCYCKIRLSGSGGSNNLDLYEQGDETKPLTTVHDKK